MTILVLARVPREGIRIPLKHITIATITTTAVHLILKPLEQSMAVTILALATVYTVLLVLKILRIEELQTITKAVLKPKNPTLFSISKFTNYIVETLSKKLRVTLTNKNI